MTDTATAPVTDPAAVAAAARHFMASHRRRRCVDHRPEPRLSVWAAWEEARGALALSVAEALDHWPAFVEADLAAYKVAAERMRRAGDRFLAGERAEF